jgi:hypothetical protein
MKKKIKRGKGKASWRLKTLWNSILESCCGAVGVTVESASSRSRSDCGSSVNEEEPEEALPPPLPSSFCGWLGAICCGVSSSSSFSSSSSLYRYGVPSSGSSGTPSRSPRTPTSRGRTTVKGKKVSGRYASGSIKVVPTVDNCSLATTSGELTVAGGGGLLETEEEPALIPNSEKTQTLQELI